MDDMEAFVDAVIWGVVVVGGLILVGLMALYFFERALP